MEDDGRYGFTPQGFTNHLKEHLDEANDAARVGNVAEYVRQIGYVHTESLDIMRLMAARVLKHGMDETASTLVDEALEYDDEH